MLWKRKGWLRKQFNDQLIERLQHYRDEWMDKKQLIEKSVEPSEKVIFDLKIAEAKYLFLLREAKKRKVSIGKG
ncbi:YaaL family protein [Anoxybacillus sp. MB8]|uniref:YaaL family protein n=1 Tax=Anoxybacillus sp. MB8 TaxID=2496850 RepID=UPI0013D5795D|nr:YaaL family protein [Anoxybacillus sp. MB8]